MALTDKQRCFLQWFFPGLIEKLEQLGPGRLESENPTIRPRRDGIGAVEIRVNYFLTEGSMYLELHVSLKLDANKPPFDPKVGSVDLKHWKRTYYSLGYQKLHGDRVFACDFDRNGRHVHMLPDVKKHVHVDETEPNTSDIDPRDFVDLIAKYRRDKTCPVKRVPRRPKK